MEEVNRVPSSIRKPISLATPTLSRKPSYESSVLGDPQAAPLYKVRRNARSKSRSRVACCTRNVQRPIKIWAFSNLAITVLDLWFSICELVALTTPIKLSRDWNSMHWTLYLVLYIMHGDCIELLFEMMINFSGELMYTVSSLLFAFATVLVDTEKEDNSVARYLTHWFLFTEWAPLVCLLPRFILNVVSQEYTHTLNELFPESNENAPRIAFWIANLLHVFFMGMWLTSGRLVALQFLKVLKEESDQSKQGLRAPTSASRDIVTAVPSITVFHAAGAGDKALRSSGVGALLPPSVALV